MTNETWISDLNSTLESVRQQNPNFCVIIMGVGNTLHGDDALGPVIARMLHPTFENNDRILVIDAGTMPENFTGVIRRFHPDVLLLIDTSQPVSSPGAIRMLRPDVIQHYSVSTHRTSLNLFSKYLLESLDCAVTILTIEAVDVSLNQGLSLPVRRAARLITRDLAKLLLQ